MHPSTKVNKQEIEEAIIEKEVIILSLRNDDRILFDKTGEYKREVVYHTVPPENDLNFGEPWYYG